MRKPWYNEEKMEGGNDMIDTTILSNVLEKYKANFVDKGWADESFKWAAVKYFQDNWDVNAEDFAAMFDKALNAPKVYLGLLASANNFPVGMMSSFAKAAPEEVRAMFIELFDESKDVVDRILSFKKKSDYLLEKYGDGAKQHYQYENAISGSLISITYTSIAKSKV